MSASTCSGTASAGSHELNFSAGRLQVLTAVKWHWPSAICVTLSATL